MAKVLMTMMHKAALCLYGIYQFQQYKVYTVLYLKDWTEFIFTPSLFVL